MTNLYTSIIAFYNTRSNDDRGASLVEYALLVALIAVVCIAAISVLGTAGAEKLSSVGESIAK